MSKTEAMPEARKCAAPGCGQEFAADARPDRRYCSTGCRSAALRASENRQAARDYFHGCPECPPERGPADVYNAGSTHRAACHEHRTTWLLGSNLFSRWRDETEAEQRARYAEIEGYRDVTESAIEEAHREAYRAS